MSRSGKRALNSLFRWQTERPGALLLVALLTVVVALLGAMRLELRTSFGELLPRGKESVLVAERVADRLVSASTLIIVAQGEDTVALKRFVDALAPEVRALGPELVGNVDNGVRASREFFQDNRFLYAPLDRVQKARDSIVERYEAEVAKRAGTDLGLDDEPGPGKPAITLTAASIRDELGKPDTAPANDEYPDGYYLEKTGKLIVLLVRTPVASGDIERSRKLLARIEEVIARVDPKTFDPSMTVHFTGDFITSAEEYNQIKGDLSHVGVAGVAMILAVVFLFYLRIRTLVAMALTVGIGVVWTFGLAYLTIGHLNSSTGFLVSIVVGNGINFGIIYMARYLEARRAAPVLESIAVANRETWLPTLAAAGAAMTAYGSLIVTDFRGFKHFGLIGGSGMILCWIATYLFLPALLVGSERISPVSPESGLSLRLRAAYGRPFAWAAQRLPRSIALGGLVLGLAAAALSVRYVLQDPMEYNMWNVRSEAPAVESDARTLSSRVDPIIGRQGQEGVAIMVDRVDQVLPLKAALEQKRDAAPEGEKPFDKVVTLYDLLPRDQAEKIALLADARDKIERAHRRRFFSEAEWTDIQKDLPPAELHPIGLADLPEQVARAFIEKDGTRGRLVYIVPSTGVSIWDAHYLIRWADAFRSTVLPDGSVIKGSGRSVIFADLILTVIEDAPKAIIVSVLGTMLVIALAFRGRAAAVQVIATLALGIVWMIAAMALYKAKVTFAGGLPHVELVGMKLNFLNFVALPISIGVGADYAVNIMQRYRIAGPTMIRQVVTETGGAVILCSLTTMLGYLALTLSVNLAIVSFGYAAAAGEISCVLAAVLVLPAWLVWRARAKRAGG